MEIVTLLAHPASGPPPPSVKAVLDYSDSITSPKLVKDALIISIELEISVLPVQPNVKRASSMKRALLTVLFARQPFSKLPFPLQIVSLTYRQYNLYRR